MALDLISPSFDGVVPYLRREVIPELYERAEGRAPILAIVGASGSGKSYLAGQIAESVRGSRIVSQDEYYRNDSGINIFGRTINDESLGAFLTRYRGDVEILSGRQPVSDSPTFDLANGRRTGSKLIPAPSRYGLVIAEGLQVVNALMVQGFKHFDFAIYVESIPWLTVLRKSFRDLEERGAEVDLATLIARGAVSLGDFRTYRGEDQRSLVNLVIQNHFNPVKEIVDQAVLPQDAQVA